MSSNLNNSAALTASTAFQGLVLAAIREHAIDTLTDRSTGTLQEMWMRHALARAVVHDARGLVEKFVGIVADDETVSATSDPALVDTARVRTVVASVWGYVAASTPGVG